MTQLRLLKDDDVVTPAQLRARDIIPSGTVYEAAERLFDWSGSRGGSLAQDASRVAFHVLYDSVPRAEYDRLTHKLAMAHTMRLAAFALNGSAFLAIVLLVLLRLLAGGA